MWLRIQCILLVILFWQGRIIPSEPIIPENQKNKILFIGDSHISEGTVATTVATHFNLDYEVVAWAGASARDFLAQDTLIPKTTYRLCIVSLGTNWSKDIKNYQKLVRQIRKYQKNMVLTTPNQVYYNMDRLQCATLEIGKQLQIPVWDFYRYSKISHIIENKHLMKPDKVHLTKTGYLLQARLLCEFLEEMNW